MSEEIWKAIVWLYRFIFWILIIWTTILFVAILIGVLFSYYDITFQPLGVNFKQGE